MPRPLHRVEDALDHLVAGPRRLTLVGVPLFLWFSTRLSAGARGP